MHYKFPVINHIDDVLPAIEGRNEFGVYYHDTYDIVVINYNVNFEDTFPEIKTELDAIRRECRGIVFQASTGKILARRYHKFFNLGEREEVQPHLLDFTRPHTVLGKLDGCCSGTTVIDTPDGPMTIQELCEIDYKGLVLGYNHSNQVIEWVTCYVTSIDENEKEWYEIELADGSILTLTSNHKVWCLNRNEYVRADELTNNDEVLIR